MPRHLGLSAAVVGVLGVLVAGQQLSGDVRLTLREGTSMAAAVSPDGRTIAIDLLGALWTVSIDGGRATRILEDGYDARMPVWSPDGKRLAFQAYRSSTWSIWTINADGSGARQVTWGPFDDREPHWSADGSRLAFSSDRSGNYDVWSLTLATGELKQITTNAANDFMPAWSPEGNEIAFVSDRTPRGIYAVAIESGVGSGPASARTQSGELRRGLAEAAASGREGGESAVTTGGERLLAGDAKTLAAPAWSVDGKSVTYVAIDGPVSQLVLAGANIAEANEDVFPFRAQWLSPRELLYTADGTIKRRLVGGGPPRVVPFSADVVFPRSTFVPRARSMSRSDAQPVRGIMHPTISPDGKRVMFAALGDLWTAPTTGGEVTPERVTNDAFVETDPAWSPDGKMIVFSSDRDGSMDLWVRDLITRRADRKLASRAMSAAWSPDGTRIAFLDAESQLQVVDVASGAIHKAHDRLNEPGRPSWSPDGHAIVMSALRPYSTRFREGTNRVVRVGTRSGPGNAVWFDPVPHKSIGMREDGGPVWSPDGSQMAAIVDGHLAVFPVARDGAPIGPARRLSPDLANSPSWTGDSRHLLYQSVQGLRLVDAIDGSISEIVPTLSWTAASNSGAMTVHAGRLFDGRTTRENVDIVIEGNRIARVEAHRAELHGAGLVDASQGTVLPGMIESHTHLSKSFGEGLGRIFLSFGVTSVRNPATNPFEGQEDREAIESGVRIGPRVFTTGEPFDGTRIYYAGGTALDGGVQVTEQLGRAEALGFDFIKTYVRLPDVLQQRVVEGAHRLGLPVTSHEIYPAVAYGADGVEHIRGTSRRGYSPKMSELRRSYRDVIDLLAASKMTLTPTIGIQGGFQVLTARDASWIDDARIQRFFSNSAAVAARMQREKPMSATDLAQREALVTPQERMVAEVVKAGGRVIAGTDSPINPYGLTLLMELEHFVRGGLSPADAIRTATVIPAEAMGLGAELGSIEAGKLADLVIVDGNPLVNIVDIRRTRRVIKDGKLYEVDALIRGPVKQSSSR